MGVDSNDVCNERAAQCDDDVPKHVAQDLAKRGAERASDNLGAFDGKRLHTFWLGTIGECCSRWYLSVK